MVVEPAVLKEADVQEPASDEASVVTPARGLEVRYSGGDSIGWLDPGVTTEKSAAPRTGTARVFSAAWGGITKAVRFLCCCPPK